MLTRILPELHHHADPMHTTLTQTKILERNSISANTIIWHLDITKPYNCPQVHDPLILEVPQASKISRFMEKGFPVDWLRITQLTRKHMKTYGYTKHTTPRTDEQRMTKPNKYKKDTNQQI